MIGSKFFVFGGQVDGEFLNDLWAFDLNSRTPSHLPLRQSSTDLSKVKTQSASWEKWEPASADRPAPRTGHVCIAFEDQIILYDRFDPISASIYNLFFSSFGGTDRKYHYNDTWSFNLQTRTWTELNCIGFIPHAREGHAAAIIGNVMYVFGGRGVDGMDLSDLVAFKISSACPCGSIYVFSNFFPDQRWYMFQGMGPSPSGRSGHAMASFQSKVFVLGGESFAPSKTDDFTHVLDTSQSSVLIVMDMGPLTLFFLPQPRTHQISRGQQRTASFRSSSRKPKYVTKTHSNTSKYSRTATAARSNTKRQ